MRGRPNIKKYHRQTGYVLVLVLLLLTALMVGSVQFMSRTAIGAQISVSARDNDETVLLAENAANLLLGRFMYGADINNDGIADNTQLRIDPMSLDQAIALPYVFAVSGGKSVGMDQTRPSLLQRVADGEAHAFSIPDAAADYTVVPQIFQSAATQLRIAQLFSTGKPLLFKADDSGALSRSSRSWSDEDALRKAAAWIELVREPADDAYLRIYVEAAAQIGQNRAHIQRFGGFLHVNLLGNLATLTESSANVSTPPPMANAAQ